MYVLYELIIWKTFSSINSNWNKEYLRRPNSYWSDLSKQRELFDHLGKILSISNISNPLHKDITKLDDWISMYRKNLIKNLRKHGAGTVIKFYDGSISKGNYLTLNY